MSGPFSRNELVSAPKAIVRQRRKVKFQDVDAAGTIYFARVLEYFGDAYLEVLTRAGLDVPAILKERRWAAPVAHAEADFLGPLYFGDDVDVDVVAARVGKTSVTFGHRLSAPDGAVAAVGQTVHVFVDGRTFAPAPVPDELRSWLEGVTTLRDA